MESNYKGRSKKRSEVENSFEKSLNTYYVREMGGYAEKISTLKTIKARRFYGWTSRKRKLPVILFTAEEPSTNDDFFIIFFTKLVNQPHNSHEKPFSFFRFI